MLAFSFASPAARAADRPAHLNEVFWGASHNSYWVKRDNVVELFASGSQERLLDILLFDHVRALELDIHHDDGNPGVWTVYHTDKQSNSLCTPLSECLKQLQQFHYANPDHEPVTVVLELKEILEQNFDATHTPADLDQLIRTYLGDHLYSPGQFLSRCPAGSSMRDCARTAGWPTLQELRGKFIFTTIGNWHYCLLGQGLGHGPMGWATYATWGKGVADRVAFPHQSQFSDYRSVGCNYDTVPTAMADQAEAASVIMQVEETGDPMKMAQAAQFISDGLLIRGHDSYSLADQQARVQAGFQMLQSDYAWLQYRDSGPGMPMRPLDDKTFSDWTQFREPGSKIALNRIPAGSGMAFLSLVDNTGATDWETIPATTRPSPDNTYANSHWTRGKGCLRAEANDGSGDYFSVCRQTIDGHWYDPDHLGEMARITVESSRDGRRSYRDFYSGDNHSNGIGDQIRMQVSRSPGSTQTCATPYTASELAAPSTPAWSNLGAMCFRRGLPIQGVTAQYGDVLFVGTKKSGISGYLPVSALKAPDAFATGYLLQDQSYFPVAARQMVRSLLTLFRLKR